MVKRRSHWACTPRKKYFSSFFFYGLRCHLVSRFDGVVFKFVLKRDVLQKATKHNSYHSIWGEGFPTPSQQSVKASPANRILPCGWTVTVGGTIIKQWCKWGLAAMLWLALCSRISNLSSGSHSRLVHKPWTTNSFSTNGSCLSHISEERLNWGVSECCCPIDTYAIVNIFVLGYTRMDAGRATTRKPFKSIPIHQTYFVKQLSGNVCILLKVHCLQDGANFLTLTKLYSIRLHLQENQIT